MTTIKHFTSRFYVLSLALLFSNIAFAQEAQKPAPKPQPANVPITVAAVGERVRFTAIGAVERMRLEVFDAAGQTVFDTGFKPGNVRDWRLVDAHGQRLLDGTYQCAVTVRELTGRMSFKQGSILVQGGLASQALDGGGQSGAIEPEQALSERNTAEPSAMTVVAHDGEDGQVTSTTGDLTFRTGDLFSGKDRERMRLTEDGKLGVGTKEPQATLDVNGTVRASKGVAFPDGTVLTSATGRAQKVTAGGEPEPLVAGTGTTGKLTKWTDNAGTLGDSVVTEFNSNIGIGAATPNSKLTVGGPVEVGATAGAGSNPTLQNPNNLANFSQLIFYPAGGTNVNSSFSIIPRGTGQANNRAQLVLLNTDRVASPNNFELAAFRARGNDFLIGTGSVGAGVVNRPLMLGAGLLTDNTNDGQLFLATDGNVGVGTTTPTSKLHVNGSINFTGLRTETNATSPNVVGGFSGNTVTAGVAGATIGGGGGSTTLNINRVTDSFGTVGGGARNLAGDNAGATNDRTHATVGGGSNNKASGRESTVGGGSGNEASAANATVGGGLLNIARGASATVGGGSFNDASGTNATIPGGSVNRAQGTNSFAAGQRAQAIHQSTFVWSDSTASGPDLFSSTAANQFLINATGGVGVGTNAPNHQLTIGVPENPVVDSARVGVYVAGGAYVIARDTTNNVEGLFGAESGAALFGSMTNHAVQLRTNNNTRMTILGNGNIGIGTTSPGTAKLKVEGGDLFIQTPNSLVIRSPNGACWRIVVSNGGALTATSVTCP